MDALDKYIKDYVEHTGAEHYFFGSFLRNNILYNGVSDSIMNGLINNLDPNAKMLAAFMTNPPLSSFSEDELKEEYSMFLAHCKNKLNKLSELGEDFKFRTDYRDDKAITVVFTGLPDYIRARKLISEFHTPLCVGHTTEFILMKVDKETMIDRFDCDTDDNLDYLQSGKEAYVFFWFDNTRDNLVAKIVINKDKEEELIRDVEERIKELSAYLYNEDNTCYTKIPVETYIGWISK